MKAKALRSFLFAVDGDGNRDIMQEGEVRDISKDQFNEMRIHGLVEVKEDEAKADSKKK
jgi:hypothetical protein